MNSIKLYVCTLAITLLATAAFAQDNSSGSEPAAIGGKIDKGWEICNVSSEPVVYVAYVTYKDEQWVKQGWRQINRNECSTILSSLTSRYVFYYAKSAKTIWAGDKNFCANPADVFKWSGSGVCPDEFELLKFVTSDTGEFELFTTRLAN